MLHWVCIFWDTRVAPIRQYEMCTSGLEGSGLVLNPRSPGKVEDEDEWLVWTGTCDNHENATTKRLERATPDTAGVSAKNGVETLHIIPAYGPPRYLGGSSEYLIQGCLSWWRMF
jgi:hypothetical protein